MAVMKRKKVVKYVVTKLIITFVRELLFENHMKGMKLKPEEVLEEIDSEFGEVSRLTKDWVRNALTRFQRSRSYLAVYDQCTKFERIQTLLERNLDFYNKKGVNILVSKN
jgi:histidyl-tRNA synthetase